MSVSSDAAQSGEKTSKTVKLRIDSNGGLFLAHPLSRVGFDHLTYAIDNVPADVAPGDVMRHVSKLGVWLPMADSWRIDWRLIAELPPGSMVTRPVLDRLAA
jgi:hypothetical protein